MRLRIVFERYGPLIVGLCAAGLFIWAGSTVITYAQQHKWNVPTIYSSVFDLCSLITAFVFSFFTFARTSETEFLHRMRKTTTYARFMRYLVSAMNASAALVIISIPFMIAEPQPATYQDPWFWACAAWIALVGFTLTATARSMRQFIAIAMVDREA